MSGKGDKRRPPQVSYELAGRLYDLVFGKKKKNKSEKGVDKVIPID